MYLFKKFVLFYLMMFPRYVVAQQEGALLAYNVGFSAVSSGIGSVINKQKGENWKHAFVKGAWQGSIGGVLIYSGKKTLYLVNKEQQLAYAWPARILYAAGASIQENAAQNHPFLQNWNINIGPVRFDYTWHGKFRARLLPMFFVLLPYVLHDAQPNVTTSLLTGTLACRGNDTNYVAPGVRGSAYGWIYKYAQHGRYEIIAHELGHVFQYGQYQVFNSWFVKPAEAYIPKPVQKIFQKYIYFDAPYFYPFYLLQKSDRAHYYRNFYEFEAQRFATNQFIYR